MMAGTAVQRRTFSPEFGQKVLVDRTSLQMSEKLSYPEWVELGSKLTEVGDSMAWWVGDWIEQGTVVYGGKYEAALEVMKLDRETLHNYALVARRFSDTSRRRDELRFGHHQVVASLEPAAADAWLERAAKEQWSVLRLRDEVRAARALPADGADDDTRVTLEQLRVTIPQERAERWRSAADRAGLSIEEAVATAVDEWVARTLADAA